jgi:hypothetical protein
MIRELADTLAAVGGARPFTANLSARLITAAR